MNLIDIQSWNVGQTVGQLRAWPLQLGANVNGAVAWYGALANRRGEQLLVFRPNGDIRLVGDADVSR